ncbi:MAG: hypothetical protein GOU99_03075 [Candidatus Altiarchaeota archaeon]|nr:hypothetical protein [Candidatus Altiarchaeota archaeon]
MEKQNWTRLFAVLLLAVAFVPAVMAMPWQFYFAQPSEDMEFPGVNNETIAQMQATYEHVRAAIESGNYTEWRQAMEGLLTEEAFQQHVEFHNAQQEKQQLMDQLRQAWEDGDYDTIAQIRANLTEQGMMDVPHGQGQGLEKPTNDHVPQGNAWGRMKQAFGKLAFWRR